MESDEKWRKEKKKVQWGQMEQSVSKKRELHTHELDCVIMPHPRVEKVANRSSTSSHQAHKHANIFL